MQSNSTERSQFRDAALPPPLVAATPKVVPVTYRTPSLPDSHIVAVPSSDAPSPSSSLESDLRAMSRKNSTRAESDGDHLANSDRLNDYRIVGVIFAGTPVRVILAQHDSREPEKKVAIKCFDRALISHPERIDREIAASRAACHPHIVRFIEAFATPREVCIAMEYGVGGDLFTHLARHGPIASEHEACRLFSHMLRALEFCHLHLKQCHRDVKPENLLFDSDHPRTRRLKLVDFGLSCALNDARSLLHGACGTPVYSAPEVFAQRYDGVRADLWSAGVTLYVMLTGRLPFEVEAPMSAGAAAMTTSGRRGSVGTKSGFGTLAHASTRTSGSSTGHQLVNSSSNSNIISASGIGSGSSSNNTSTGMGVASTSCDGLGSRDSLGGGNGSGTASSGRVRASDFELLAQRVQSGRFRMPAHVSPAAADLLRAMLDPDPAARPLHDGIRQHAWCRAHGVLSDSATAAHSVAAAVAAEVQATTAAAAALVGSATGSAVDTTGSVHDTETAASFQAPGSAADPVIVSDAYFTVSSSTGQSSELSSANSNAAARVVSPLATYPSVRTSSDAWWDSEPATGFNAASYAHSFARPSSVSRSLSNAQSASTIGVGSGSMPSSSSSSGYSESAVLSVKGTASSSTFSTPQRARTISSVAFVGVGGIAPALRQSSSGFLSPALVDGSGADTFAGSDSRNRAAGRSRSNSHGGSLSGFDSSAEVDVASMTPLAAARSLSQSWSMRASASEKGMGGGGLSGAYSVARGTSASQYPTMQPTGSIAAASLASSSTSSALKTSTSLTASSASWSSSWAAARASNNASPMRRTVSFTSSSASASVVAPALSSTLAAALTVDPIMNGSGARDCNAGAFTASLDAVLASSGVTAISAAAAATTALATLHLSPPLLSTVPPSLSSALMPVFNLGVSSSSSVSLSSDEGISMALAIDADSSVLPTIDEREPAHWCGAGEDDDEGVDDDFPHRSNQSQGAATDSHSPTLAGSSFAELPVSASSSAVADFPSATDSSPVLAALAAPHVQPQPISPLPHSPSLTARVPSSPSKTMLGIQIDSSSTVTAAATRGHASGSNSGGSFPCGSAKDAPLPSLVVRASLGAARPLQTLTPVSSVGAHLNLLGSPSTVALSALSAALASASAAAADGSGGSELASPTHRGGVDAGDLRFAPPVMPLLPTAAAPGPGWYWGVDDEAEEEYLDD